MLSIQNLHVTIGKKPILKREVLALPADEVHAIMGPDGAVLCYAEGQGEQR